MRARLPKDPVELELLKQHLDGGLPTGMALELEGPPVPKRRPRKAVGESEDEGVVRTLVRGVPVTKEARRLARRIIAGYDLDEVV